MHYWPFLFLLLHLCKPPLLFPPFSFLFDASVSILSDTEYLTLKVGVLRYYVFFSNNSSNACSMYSPVVEESVSSFSTVVYLSIPPKRDRRENTSVVVLVVRSEQRGTYYRNLLFWGWFCIPLLYYIYYSTRWCTIHPIITYISPFCRTKPRVLYTII